VAGLMLVARATGPGLENPSAWATAALMVFEWRPGWATEAIPIPANHFPLATWSVLTLIEAGRPKQVGAINAH